MKHLWQTAGLADDLKGGRLLPNDCWHLVNFAAVGCLAGPASPGETSGTCAPRLGHSWRLLLRHARHVSRPDQVSLLPLLQSLSQCCHSCCSEWSGRPKTCDACQATPRPANIHVLPEEAPHSLPSWWSLRTDRSIGTFLDSISQTLHAQVTSLALSRPAPQESSLLSCL